MDHSHQSLIKPSYRERLVCQKYYVLSSCIYSNLNFLISFKVSFIGLFTCLTSVPRVHCPITERNPKVMSGNQRLQSKRRQVPSEKRKRALFSCDRCKLRKTKCNRIQNNDLKYDNITPCLQCTKAGVACTTSIPRKKRFYGPVKNIAFHYKCLLSLVAGLFPDSDIYSFEDLIDLGHKLKIEMPKLDLADEEDNETLENLKTEKEAQPDKAITEKTDLMPKKPAVIKSESVSHAANKNEDIPRKKLTKRRNEIDSLEATENQESTSKQLLITENKEQPKLPKLPPGVKLKNSDNERLIMDRFGHTHFIGNFGTASLLNGLCDIIIKNSFNKKKPPTSTQDLRDHSVQTITSDNAPAYQYPKQLYNFDRIEIDRFPLINTIEKEEADFYMKIFFEKVHPYYFIFNRELFMEKYHIFWEEIDADMNREKADTHTVLRLSSAEICSIYMVWILGKRFQQYSFPEILPSNAKLDDETISKLIDIIKLSFTDVVLTPSIDGIRLLILFSVYLSSIKVRESGYCLMELAVIQAKSLGLHRKSIVAKFNEKKADVMKRILWSLAKSETILSYSFGRSSGIPWEEIDIGLPTVEDETDEEFKVFYSRSCMLTKIIFEILDYKKKSHKEPLSLVSVEKALYFRRKLEKFWEGVPEIWKDYKSLPINRYKPKLHIQYHYYYIALTLPMFLYIVNSQSYIIKNDDPFLALLVCGIKSSFKTAEIISYTDSKGFFNGTIYFDIFYCYNAIMVLTLSYTLFKSSQNSKEKQIIDLDNLDKKYGINLDEVLKSINLIRKLIWKNLGKIDGTMRRMSDIIETLLDDLGIIQILVVKYGAKPSNVKNIETKDETGKTSVSSISTGYRKIKLNLNQQGRSKRTRTPTPKNERPSKSPARSKKPRRFDNMPSGGGLYPFSPMGDDQAEPYSLIPTESPMGKDTISKTDSPRNFEATELDNPALGSNEIHLANNATSASDNQPALDINANDNINDVLNSLSLNNDLMDALFGSELFNLEEDLLL